jgi:hypothetical protein
MPEAQPTPDPAEAAARDEWSILICLLDSDNQRPWSVEELIRERGNRVAALDAIRRLRVAGLLHQQDDFCFASRPAVRYHQIHE